MSIALIGLLLIGGLIAYSLLALRSESENESPSDSSMNVTEETKESPPMANNPGYDGTETKIADIFSVKVPNGWRASVSTSPRFTAIMFAQPNQLDSLKYDSKSQPTVDYDGITSWNGLTEHFFIIAPNASQSFDPADHSEVNSTALRFDDGTEGRFYYVTKHAEEAAKWGGLQKDDEWQGRTYIYEKFGKRVEAHIAAYPSTNIDIAFYEEVAKSIRIIGE